ncbi:stable inheritance protein KleA [Bordetella bronchialis]|uniref:stable inheritance protein KleA n=1 Tax=Bordetella bronchialis TaxID=463025 RepID=UPI003D063455
MVDEKFLAAVQRLPEVGTPIQRDCEVIHRTLRRADELEESARVARMRVECLAGALRAKLAKNWSRAKFRAAGVES